jgi:Domain of unknown function (DUF4262)
MGSGWDDRVAEMMLKVGANITRCGWHATGVFGGGGSFMYTTGLTTGDHPELVIAGLPPETAHGLIAAAVGVIRSGVPLAPGRDYAEIATGFPVRFAEVDQDACEHPLSVTNRHYGRRVPALQLLWPDPEGRFPGEDGCDPKMAAAQNIGGN